MTVNLIGLYDSLDPARKAMQELKQAGIEENKIQVCHGDQGPSGDQLKSMLTQRGFNEHEGRISAEAVRQGRALLIANMPDEKADNALEIMNRHGARSTDELEGELQQGGRQQGGEQQQRETIPQVEEQVSIGKRKVQGGGARIRTEVTERPVEETVTLREEKVDVERHKADRPLSPEEADKAFKERSEEVTATKEKPVVSKEARVTGEVEIKKTAEEHEEKVQAKERKTDIKVEEKAGH